jgi:hypothetical protein
MMSDRALFELDPQQIKVRVAVENGFEVDATSTELTLTIATEADTKNVHSYHLNLLQRFKDSRPGGIFHSDFAVVTYELALTPESVAELLTIPDNAKSVRFWIDLKLRQSESYMVLFDGAQMNITRSSG